MPVLDTAALIDDRVGAIRDYHEQNGFQRAELDVSGGVDSATMLHLLARAIGTDNVTAVFTGIHSSASSRERAHEAAAAAGIALVELELSATFDELTGAMLDALTRAGWSRQDLADHMEADPTVLGSFRSCLRAPIGRAFNRLTRGGLRHGTGNECEDRFLRFYQKGGDGEVDSNPLAMLSKGEVYQLARALGTPRSIIEATPTPDLHGNGNAHSDEEELRATYGIDWTYSRVDALTGAYTRVGSIERMSRLLDVAQARIFAPEPPSGPGLDALVREAAAHTFRGHDDAEIRDWIRSAHFIERVTRHKWNPRCPTYGDRPALVAAGILTNELPDV